MYFAHCGTLGVGKIEAKNVGRCGAGTVLKDGVCRARSSAGTTPEMPLSEKVVHDPSSTTWGAAVTKKRMTTMVEEENTVPAAPTASSISCALLSGMTDLASANQWCGDSEERNASQTACEAHYRTWTGNDGRLMAGRCGFVTGHCKLVEEIEDPCADAVMAPAMVQLLATEATAAPLSASAAALEAAPASAPAGHHFNEAIVASDLFIPNVDSDTDVFAPVSGESLIRLPSARR